MTYTDTTPDDDCPTCGWGQSYCTCDPMASEDETMSHKNGTFGPTLGEWIAALDRTCRGTLGLSVHDLPDMDFAAMHEIGHRPDADTLGEMLEDAGMWDEAEHVIRWAR